MLAFTHIPKTAGTTLNYILQKNFGYRLNSVILRKGPNYNYADLKKDNFIYGNAICIAGHGVKPFINYKEYNDRLKWFTFLRDPIKRYVSQYIHQQTGELKQYHLPIEKWGEKYARSNWQVKWIAGEEDLEAAMQIIDEKFIFIGLTEKFDESLLMMKNIFNLNIDILYDKPKMVVRNNDLKDEFLKTRYTELLPFYREQNELDLKLYDYVMDKVYPKQKRKSIQTTTPLTKFNLIKFKLKRDLVYKPYVLLTR